METGNTIPFQGSLPTIDFAVARKSSHEKEWRAEKAH
jgi:hypothetical protein